MNEPYSEKATPPVAETRWKRHETDEGGGTGPFPSHRRLGPARLIIAIILLVCAVVFLGKVLQNIGPDKILHAVMEANPLLLALTVAAVSCRSFIWSIKWAAITRRLFPGVRTSHCWPLVMCGEFINLVTPTARTAGGFLRCYLLSSRHNLPPVRLYGAVLQDQVTNIMGLWFVSFLALAAFPLWYDPSFTGPGDHLIDANVARLLSLFGIIGGLTLVVLSLTRRRLGRLLSRPAYERPLSILHTLIGWIPAIRNRYPDKNSFLDAVRVRASDIFNLLFKFKDSKRVGPRDIFLGGLVWLCLCTGNYLTFRACGAGADEISLPLVIAVLSAGNLAGLLSTVPGGIGVTEASLIGFYILAGVRPDLAAAASLLFRLTFYCYALIAGSISMAWVTRSGKRRTSLKFPD